MSEKDKKYCGECITCVSITNPEKISPVQVGRLLPKDRKLFREGRCLSTKNRIKEDGRFKDDIKVVKKKEVAETHD